MEILKGNYVNICPKIATHTIERVLRPWQIGRAGCEETKWKEVFVRIKEAVIGVFFIPLMVVTYPVSLLASTIEYIFQHCRLQIDRDDFSGEKNVPKKLKIFFLNICCQSGSLSSLTGDQIHPLEMFDKDHKTRVDAIVDFSTRNNPDLICFQEAHDSGAISLLREKLQIRGYRVVSDKVVHPIFVNSGLMVAIKKTIPVNNIHFIEYPLKDRAGITKGSLQGCMSVDIVNKNEKKILRVITTHLAFGNSLHVKEVRRRQVENYIFSTFTSDEPVLLGGDFNEHHLLDTMKKEKNTSKLYDYLDCNTDKKNSRVLQGQIRKKRQKEECVDGVIYSSKNSFIVKNSCLLEPKLNGRFVSDHFATEIELENL